MLHIALAAPVSPTVVDFHSSSHPHTTTCLESEKTEGKLSILFVVSGGAKQWSALFPSFRRSRGAGSSLFASSLRKRLQLRFFASGENGGTGGAVEEISEAEKEPTNFAWPDNKNYLIAEPRVCILGGGFGGLYTALRLESLEWPDDKKTQIVLVDQSECFVFKPMLYELLSGEVDKWEIAPPFSDLLANTSVQFFKDRVKVLNPSDHWGMNGSKASSCGGTVHLESGLLVEYDWLVLALGAESKLDVVPGAVEFAIPFSMLEDAPKVNDKLTKLERKTFGKDFQISVAVIGCGIVRAINVETMICPNAQPGNREVALKVLSSRKVELLLGYFVCCIQRLSELESSDTLTGADENSTEVVPDFEKYILELQPAERGMQSKIVEADLVLWTAGTKPPLPQLEPSDVAFQQADFTGWNLWAAINGRPLLPFRFQNLGEMMTLGRNDAAISPSFIDGLTLEGSVGHTARKIAYLIRLPTDEHRLKVGISWLTKSAIDSVSSLQSTLYKVVSGS
uniref:FAD/NAD(P)-binding domain-containing protein n=1 Tax=Glycine max TaxID=3847 RepID=K7L482_SOYBN